MTTSREFREYRKTARKIVLDITLIEARYCWFTCVAVSYIAERIKDLRAEEAANRVARQSYPVKAKAKAKAKALKGPRKRPMPKWLRPPRQPRSSRIEGPYDMHGRARALLRKLTPG